MESNFKKIMIGIMLIFFIPNIFANVILTGSENIVMNNSKELITEFKLNSQVINFEDVVKADLEIIYEVRRINDLSVFYFDSFIYSLAPYEVKAINDVVKVDKLSAGLYQFDIKVNSASGAPLTFIRKNFEISGEDSSSSNVEMIYFSTLPNLKIFYEYDDGRTRYEHSFSNTGKAVIPNSTFYVKFELDNLNDFDVESNIEITFKNSYSRGEEESFFENEYTLVKENKTFFEIPLIYDKAGTYDLFVNVFDENGKLNARKEVRLVIAGEGGTIMDVFNLNDVYLTGEMVNIQTQHVGPADGITWIPDVFLKLEVIKQDRIVYSEVREFDELSFSPETTEFLFNASEELDKYKVRVILGRGNETYDTVELNYEKLIREIFISPDGRIYNSSLIACYDDDVCTEEEKGIGDCLDCNVNFQKFKNKKLNRIEAEVNFNGVTPEETKDNTAFIMIMVFIMSCLALASFVHYFGKKKRNNQK